ncbi:MAG: T9SS C-terminal target domain-containing protein [Bacteroidia bacterium]|nr:T9SS C-terminal target domain-containing protein [Bacteroidia bacterium]
MKKVGLSFIYYQFRLYLLLGASFVCTIHVMQAQKVTVPISTYGVWDRGEGIEDYSDPKADFVLGIEVSERWANVQANGPDKFDFSTFQNTLDKAAKYHKIVKVSINVGPDSPIWLYENGVPLVKVQDNKPGKHDKFPNYPYYLSDAYKKYYFEMIKQFSLFLRNQPKEKFDCIAFVQVKTGSTGDEAPYKGEPFDQKYVIARNTDWESFRLEAFAQFKKYFNDVNDRQLVLVFNGVDPDKQPLAYNWVMKTIDPQLGFGIKGGAYNRGHHLTGEQSFKEQWTPYLINPKGMKLFSAAEMDNTGLSSYNASKQAIIYAYEHKEISDIFRMYNKYAQQVYPATATAAMSVFHEGLNVADTIKFPERLFGKASEKNLDRYVRICKAYQSRGAKIDDIESVTIGQVNQREKQTGYNDVGWDIAEGNYERFLTQIKPDETSIGLFRVRGTIDKNSSKYDRFARSFENATGKNTLYFKFDDEMFATSKPESLRFTITWLDKIAGSTWSLNYNNGGKTLKSALNVKGIGDNQWKTQTVTITIVDRSGKFGSDFIVVNTDKLDDIFNGIEVDITRKK